MLMITPKYIRFYEKIKIIGSCFLVNEIGCIGNSIDNLIQINVVIYPGLLLIFFEK